MKKTRNWLLLALAVLSYAIPSHADKVDEVKMAVKKAPGCESKELSSVDTLKYVKMLYMQCNTGDTVDVDGCKVKCLKGSGGSVVGG